MEAKPITFSDEESRAIRRWCSIKNAGFSAFRARPNKGAGADRSVMLVGSRQSGWSQAIKFWGGDHQRRCDEACRQYNEAGAVR